ncbi:MAG: PDZ domain-containing protein [Planctomycetota bacterium]
MIIMSAGVFMNLVTGVRFAAAAFWFGVPYTPTIVGSVVPGGPAWRAGVPPGGQVTAVNGFEDDLMRFRDMKLEVLQAGLEDGDQELPVTMRFGNKSEQFESRQYELPMMPSPGEKSFRLIGVGMAHTTTIGKQQAAIEMSAAAEVLGEEDQGATVLAYDGIPIQQDALVPSLPLKDYINRHPSKPIELLIKRIDDSERTVILPAQKTRGIGIRFQPGPVKALVVGGPAEKAGLKVGDVITGASGMDTPSIATLLAAMTTGEPLRVTVQRDDAKVDVTIEPDDTLQADEPLDLVRHIAAMNAYGFAFEISPFVASFDPTALVRGDAFSAGDQLRSITLLSDSEFPPEFKEEPLSNIIDGFKKPWKLSNTETSWGFLDSIQLLPIGTKFSIKSEKAGSGKIIESVVQIQNDTERFQFDRGLVLHPFERTRIADSVSNAFALGLRESRIRLGEVLRFLKMMVMGKVETKFIGGPLRIFDAAGKEAERGT